MAIWPRSYGSRLYLLQLAIVAAGIVLVPLGHWRIGVSLVGAAFLGASAARLSVPAEHMGMLRVRSKCFDAAWMTLLGVSLIVLAISVPPQP